MLQETEPDHKLLTAFNVRAPQHVCETPIANIWKVKRLEGGFAALKLYKNENMQNEADGLKLLRHLDGRNAVQIYRTDHGAILMEWLSGPSLGDVSRDGNDISALNKLIDVAKGMHANPCLGYSFPKLGDWFDDLFNLKIASDCDPHINTIVQDCQRLGRRLINTQIDVRALHGDLHHDNALKGKRGYCAIDAKGVYGERGYELANAVRNPVGAENAIRQPSRILAYCQIISAKFDVDYQRFLGWALAHCSLSIAWRCGGLLKDDEDLDLLAIMYDIAKQEGVLVD